MPKKPDVIIWLYTLFGNDAELMPYFLQHYAPVCDRLVMVNNFSTDHTAQIIGTCPQAVIDDTYPAEGRGLDSEVMAKFVNEKYKEARGKADFVIWVDTDELLWAGPFDLRELLRGYRQRGVRAVKAIGYQMLSDYFPTGDTPLTEQIRYGIRDDEFDKVVIIDPNLNLYWKPGRHVCKISGCNAYSGDVRLLHYRYLGADYYARRNAYNASRKSQREIETGRSYNSDPNYTSGKYSAAWFQQAQAYATDVVSINLIEV